MTNYLRMLRDETGNVAVEFSIIAIPMLLFILGAIETSRFLWTYTALQEVVTYSVRCVGIRAQECSSDQEIVNIISTRELILERAQTFGIDLSEAEIIVIGNGLCQGIAGHSEISITYNFPNFFTLFQEKELAISACFPNQKPNL